MRQRRMENLDCIDTKSLWENRKYESTHISGRKFSKKINHEAEEHCNIAIETELNILKQVFEGTKKAS